MAKPVNTFPAPYKIAEIIPIILGPKRSTKCPIKAADIPRQKIAKLKANETDEISQPVSEMIGLRNTLQA